MTFGPPADDRFADFVHFDCRLNAGRYAQLLQRILHGERVHHRCEHAHIIGLRAVHALCSPRHAPKDISAADYEANLQSSVLGRFHFFGDAGDGGWINAELLFAH